MNKRLDIDVKTFEDFQQYLDKYGIDWTSNTGQFCRKIINAAHADNVEIVTIRLHDSVVPKSYTKSGSAKYWLKKTLREKCPYPFLQNSHPYGQHTLLIKASMFEIAAPKFRTEIIKRLKESTSGRIYYPLDDVPPIYIKQPYLLRTVLRREGFRNLTTLEIGASLMLTYEKSNQTKQSITVFTPQ